MVTPKQRLFAEDAEHDACGIGAVVSIDGKKSRETVDRALSIVEKLEHRAGKDADGETGDGVGILTQIPHAFFAKAAAELGIGIGGERDYGVGMFFFPQDTLKRGNRRRKCSRSSRQKEGVPFLGWRDVPVESDDPRRETRTEMYALYNVSAFVGTTEGRRTGGLILTRRLYVIRRVFEQSNRQHLCFVALVAHRCLQGNVPCRSAPRGSIPILSDPDVLPVPLPPFIPVSRRTRHRAGSAPTPTASSSTTAR